MSRLVFLSLLICLVSLSATAQRKNPLLSNGAVAEKIYLQTDGSVYTNDQTLWFKAVVVNAANHRPTLLSGVLYVELVGADQLIRSRKVIKLEQGVGKGFFEFDPTYKSGKYQLRAYTQWNKNFEGRFDFVQYINLYKSQRQETDIFKDLTLTTSGLTTSLQALLRTDLLDSLPENPLLKLNWAVGRDSIQLALSDNGTYQLDYTVPDTANVLSLSFVDATGERYVKNIQVKPDALDLQFFPESGVMVQGQVARVGFKAVGPGGLGKTVSGEIVNAAGEQVTTFKSNSLGMGSFSMVVTEEQYSARVISKTDDNVSLEYDLPKAVAKGTVMKILKRDSLYAVDIASNEIKSDSVFLTASMRGVRYLYVGGRINEVGQLRFKIPAKLFREGIIVFTLRDVQGRTILDRMVFNQSGKRHLEIAVGTSKDRYEQRERSRISSAVTDANGKPIKANVSYLVVNESELGALQQERHNIRSYLLMGSELKGYVEHPGYYFRPGIDRTEELDALLLTQGWRNYKYQYDVPVANRFQPEYNLTIAGTVQSAIRKNKSKEGVAVTMMSFGVNAGSYAEQSDSLGRFYFDVNEEYGQRMNVLIQTTTAKGKNKNYRLILDENEPPPVRFEPKPWLDLDDSVKRVLVQKHRERKLINDAFRPADGFIDLGEFVVEDYEITSERRKVVKAYGLPDVVISGTSIASEKRPWSSGLYSVIQRSFPEHIDMKLDYSDQVPFLRANVIGADITLVTVDGIAVDTLDYKLIPSLDISEVKSFEVLKNPTNFGRLFYEVYAPQRLLPREGAIIAIYTYDRSGLLAARRAPGIFKKSVQVFSPVREFYRPKYATPAELESTKPDYRAVIHWEPLVETNLAGRSNTSFYNADRTEEMLIVVEAIAEDGSIGYQEHRYRVVKRADRNDP